ncbi:hypothetical protein [Paenibacillus xylanexedens]|nr:hypothetical protein [Paenibacillus xylanexedens]
MAHAVGNDNIDPNATSGTLTRAQFTAVSVRVHDQIAKLLEL